MIGETRRCAVMVCAMMATLGSAWFGGQAAMAQTAPNLGPDTDAKKPAGQLSRDDIADKYKWNLADLYPNLEAWEAAFKQVEEKIDKFASLKGSISESPEALLRTLELQDRLGAEYLMVAQYAMMSYHLDMKNSEAAGRSDRVDSLGTKLGEATSWFTPEVLEIPSAKVYRWMDENEKLAVYRHQFDDVYRQKSHILNAREEELLAMAGDVTSAFSTIFGRLQNTDLDFPVIKDEKGNDVQISTAQYYKLIYSPDRRVRKDVFLGLHKTYFDKRNTISAILSGQVKQHMFYAKARGFNSSMESALNGPGIPVEVVDNLINTVHKHLPKLHQYVTLRKKVMGLDDVHRYDLRVPMLNAPDEQVPYDDAVKTILAALEPMGEEYVSTAKHAFASRWLDVYETQNKRSGAYSWGVPIAAHPFMLLNYQGTRNDRSTTAHELGHTMHSWYTIQNQPLAYSSYATFCAEVASTVNEELLAHYLMDHAKDDMERLLIVQEQMESIRTTVFRQTMFAEFEKTIHEQAEAGQPLTGDWLCKTYADIVQKYYGPELVMDEAAAAECMRIPHFYRNFYVYSYATSLCAATSIGQRIIDREPGAVEGHLKFLSAGNSMYPLDVLKLAGVDMTTPQPIEDTMKVFGELLAEFETLHAKVHKD